MVEYLGPWRVLAPRAARQPAKVLPARSVQGVAESIDSRQRHLRHLRLGEPQLAKFIKEFVLIHGAVALPRAEVGHGQGRAP